MPPLWARQSNLRMHFQEPDPPSGDAYRPLGSGVVTTFDPYAVWCVRVPSGAGRVVATRARPIRGYINEGSAWANHQMISGTVGKRGEKRHRDGSDGSDSDDSDGEEGSSNDGDAPLDDRKGSGDAPLDDGTGSGDAPPDDGKGTAPPDRAGFESKNPFYRWGKRIRGCPVGGSEAEYDRVLAGGGDFISVECSLGSNVAGTRELIVPPMAAGERLIVTPWGRHECLAAAMLASAKVINARFGRNDVAGCVFWKRLDGSVRLAHYNSVCVIALFCDNIVVESLKCPSGLSVGRCAIIEMMSGLGFKCHVPVREDKCGSLDPAAMANLYALGKICEVGNRIQWKLMLSNVPLARVGLILDVLAFARSHRGASDSVYSHVREMRVLMATHDAGLDEGKMLSAANAAKKLFFKNVDISSDLPGTLNADELKDAAMLRDAGVSVSPKTDGGLNCVYLERFEEDGLFVKMKVYNKVAETLQQGRSVRASEPGDKCGYLLNASTQRLAQLSWDSAYYETGITRLELTLCASGDDDSVPRLEGLAAVATRWVPLLSSAGVLVSCSVDEHISQMGAYVGRSILVYSPPISEAKVSARGKCTGGKWDKKRLRKTLNKIPDGYFFRWYNSLTGKHNGYPICMDFATQGHRSKCGWELAAKALAWSSSCNERPGLFIDVGGPLGPDRQSMMGMYYRAVDITRSGSALRTYLPHHCGFARGNFKNHVMDWMRIGVRCDEQDNLRFALMDPQTKASFETMGGLDIEVSSAPVVTGGWSDAESSVRSAVTGVSCRVHQAKDHNGALSEWKPWKSHKLCEGPKLEFQVAGGDRFFVPGGLGSGRLMEHLKDSPLSECEAMVDSSNVFRWRVGSVLCGSKPLDKCRAAKELPVEATPYLIHGGGLDSVGRKGSMYVAVVAGTFFVPQSIRTTILAELGVDGTEPLCDEKVNSFLRGKLISHAVRNFGRVKGQTNCEELLSIVDGSGTVHATNINEGWKRQRR